MLFISWFLALVGFAPLEPTPSPPPHRLGPMATIGDGQFAPNITCTKPSLYCRTKYHDSELRTEFLPSSCRVKAYPSLGGIVIGHLSAVQLKQIGLPYLRKTSRSYNETEEDALALSFMQHGAHWWPSWEVYKHHEEQLFVNGIPYGHHFPPRIEVGYPSSGDGVWILKFSEDLRDPPKRDLFEPLTQREPDAWEERIRMALTPDDRCEILELFDAMFYKTVEECEDIPKTLAEGVRKGKEFEELLTKMTDQKYLDEWLGYGQLTDEELYAGRVGYP